LNFFVGLDIGGTKIAAALVTQEGKIVKKKVVPTKSAKGQTMVVENIKKAINSVFDERVSGIGVGCPAPLKYPEGIIINPVNMPLRNFKLKDFLEKEFKVPTIVDNDANCFVLGEAIFGKAKNCKVVVGLTLGTGVGGGIVIDKEIIHGMSNAGELGACTIKFDGLKGKHGNDGEIEEYVSARGIMKLAKGLKAKTSLDVYNLAEKGNKKAKKAFKEHGKYLGIAISNLILTFDPDAIVIGGKVSKAWKHFNKTMFAEIKKRTMFNNAIIYPSKDAENSAILGAAWQFIKTETRKEGTSFVSQKQKVSVRIKEGIIKQEKPWGNYTRYTNNQKSTVKILTVKVNQALSLQSHNYRDELWIVLDEGLTVELGDKILKPKAGEEITIPRKTKHRLSTESKKGRVLEISFGEYDENDETRYEDKYGRK
jgi:glucokinase